MWSHGYLAGMGLAPELQSEPQRLQEQIRPDALVLQQPEAVQAPAMNLQRLRSPKRLRWTTVRRPPLPKASRMASRSCNRRGQGNQGRQGHKGCQDRH
jgi:hypothetical protein